MTRLHQARRGGGHADRARGLQRLPAAALGGPGDHHRLLPGARDRAAEHQPAAPDLRARRSTPRMRMAATFPHIDFRREVTIGHLLADIHTASGIGGKVNPPLRPREDVEALWEYLLDGKSTGSSATTPAAGTSRSSATPRDDVFARQVRLRRRRVPAARPDHRGAQARPVLQPDRRADLQEPGRAVRPARQGRHRGRARRGLRLVDADVHLDRARAGLASRRRSTPRSRASS